MLLLKSWEYDKEKLGYENIELPCYDVQRSRIMGKKAPIWIHFGGGNLYRGFHAEIAQKLLSKGEMNSGVIVCETFDNEIPDKIYNKYNNNILEVVMHSDGKLENKILSSTSDCLYCNPVEGPQFEKIVKYFEQDNLQFITLTITEKGYVIHNTDSELLDIVKSDIKNGFESPKHTMSIITLLLYKRFLVNKLPLALVSTDNFSKNGEKFKTSILEVANGWYKNGFVPIEFLDYLNDKSKISFPWSMIDRITPNPSEKVKERIIELGFSDLDITHTAMGTNIAGFVNTENINYLVIEDSFPNGRPDLTKAGVILTDRDTVDKVDIMKVTTCLNPLHTALAINGCLLGFSSIYEEMQDEDLFKLIKGIGYIEGLPVLDNPKIIDPKKFIDEVVYQRLSNPNIPDTPQRIVSDTSQKMAIRFGETIKKYKIINTDNTNQLRFIPFVIASWLRYILSVDDKGNKFSTSPDPLLPELKDKLKYVKNDDLDHNHRILQPILSNQYIFGVNLYEYGLGNKIESIFLDMLQGPGSVRKTLHEYVTE